MNKIFHDKLSSLVNAIIIRSFEGSLLLNDKIWVHPMIVSSLRGLVGQKLAFQNNHLLSSLFRPVQMENKVSACIFETITTQRTKSSRISFKVITFNKNEDLINDIREIINNLTENNFGEKTTIKQVFLCDIVRECINFPPYSKYDSSVELIIKTPLRLKSETKQWLNEKSILLAHVIKASITRLNALSRSFGNGETLDMYYLLAQAAFSVEQRRELKWEKVSRYSCYQEESIYLSGIVGKIVYKHISPELLALLQAASVFHIGKHTNVNCGKFIIKNN